MLKLRRSGLVLICILLTIATPAAVSAATTPNTSNKASSSSNSGDSTTDQSVTQGYGADASLQKGMIVKLKDSDASHVEALTTDTITQMLGVVVAANDATVTLSNDANSGQVFVASFGHYDVLVSNQNGPIKSGDYITISALAGIGMKVDTTQPVVLGRAAADFSGSGAVDGTAKLKTSSGGSVSVSIGRIPVDISISHNPLQQSVDKGLPSFLKKASEQIAGKQVGTVRVYMSLVVLAAACLLAGGMLYSGIRGGLISIGRNPLAKKQVIGGIFRVVLSGVIVFIIGLFGVYLILKL